MAEVTTDPVGGRMRDPAASARVVRMRIMFALVIGVAISMLPLFGEHRVVIGVVVGGLSLMANLLALRVIAHSGRPPALLGIADTLLALLVVLVAPQSMAVATLVSAGGLTLFVMWYGRRGALLLGLLYELGLGVVVIVHHPQWWPATMIAYALVAIGSATGLTELVRTAEEAQERYVSMVNGLDAVVWEADDENNILFVSGNVGEVLGTDPETFMEPGFYYSRIHPDDVGHLVAARDAAARGEATETHLRIRDDDGGYHWIQERQKISHNPDGSVRLRRGLVVDETDRWAAEAGLRRFMDFIEGIPVALVVLHLADEEDPGSLDIALQNPAAEALVPSAEGCRLNEVLPIDEEWLRELAAVAAGGPPFEQPFVNLPGSDAVFTIRAVCLPENHVGLTVEDITKRARLADSFRHQALHDELTGLPNRSHFRKRLIEVMSVDHPPPASLLVVDLNQFKEINDTLGHHYGDRLLREFAQRLAANLRNCDIIARLGGDEFAILLTDGASEEVTVEVAERLGRLCNERFVIDDFRFQIGASVGIAMAPQHADDAENLLRKADTAMYWAKARGGGWSMYSDAHDDRDLRRLELMGDLRDAIAGGDLAVHYQPRMSLQHDRPVGLEALVRWEHPVHGLLPPDEFIELAEVSGCIRELTQFVTTRALRETATLMELRDLSLSVNLSARTLHDQGLLDWLGTTIITQGIAENRLCFEITETELMEDPTRAMQTLHAIRAMGIRFSVDDFGTGYSSLSYLRELPIDEIKIDRSFVADLPDDDTIVRAIVDLGHNLGLHVVAEGVETRAIGEQLRQLGCDSAQGFLWGFPMAIGELERWLAHELPEGSHA